jgi:TonB-dependent receptor
MISPPRWLPGRVASVLGALCLAMATLASAQAPGEGRISGRVIDKDTGRPVVGARVSLIDRPGSMETDLDGRFRTQPLPAGMYSVRVGMIGFTPAQADSVAVRAGQTTPVSFALLAATVQLQELQVTADAPVKASNDAGLLAIQQAAPAVSDGISSQAIARSPDTDAGEAVKRVTGVTLFDGKFLVVRGLGERYSNALLNGAEMPNPVIEKKIAPLDLFPAGLLESVVASKTATPDKPGDFAGGSVELRTKDFPDSRLLQLTASQSYNDEVTFKHRALAPRGGTDWLAIDGGRRQSPVVPFADQGSFGNQQLLQSFKYNIWSPPDRRIAPGSGFGVTYGDQHQGEKTSLGLITSLTYNSKPSYSTDRLYNQFFRGQEGTASVDWGGVFNLSMKLGGTTKLGFKNLYTRSADETARSGQGAVGNSFVNFYQMRYVERYLWQSQLTGEHRLGWPFAFPSTLEWKATYGRANINDPDNHSANYVTDLDSPNNPPVVTGKRTIRSLSDKTRSAQADWSLPFTLRRSSDALFKVGAYYRAKTRSYDARDLLLQQNTSSSTGLETVVGTLPPDQAFAAENLGTYFTFIGPGPGQHDDAYDAEDRLSAAYGMIDAPLLSRVRVVSGVRLERWRLTLKPGGQDPEGSFLLSGTTIVRPDTLLPDPAVDKLWSANVTVAMSDRVNLRFAGYRTLARPDSREISPGRNSPIGGLGACDEYGNPGLRRTLITNWDGRVEFYARPGELFAVSGFYKVFNRPIIEIRQSGAGGGDGTPRCTVDNADRASVQGAEFEVRRGLDFLPGFLRHLAAGVNVTVVSSSIDFPASLGLSGRKFIGQSPFMLNSSLSWEPAASPLSVSLLYNYFSNRLTKYSNKTPPGGTDPGAAPTPNPNWVEQGRGVLDAKVRLALTSRWKLSASGKNLTRSKVQIAEDSGGRNLIESYNPGVSVSTSVSYDF